MGMPCGEDGFKRAADHATQCRLAEGCSAHWLASLLAKGKPRRSSQAEPQRPWPNQGMVLHKQLGC